MENQRDDTEEAPTAEAVDFAAAIFWVFALLSMLLIPLATKPGKRDLGWFQEPWSWPFIVLSAALIGGAAFPLRFYLLKNRYASAPRVFPAFHGMSAAIRYSLAFLGYIGAVQVLGFSIASILFMQLLYWMSGLRGGKWPYISFAVAVAIILAFRVGLGIWFPLPPLMQLLPDWVGNTFGDYL